jgi:predicted ATPase
MSASDTAFRLTSVRVRGFRSVRDLAFEPHAITALVGEARAGKSNILAALRALLDPAAPPLAREDTSGDGDGAIQVEARLQNGARISLGCRPPETAVVERDGAPAVVYLPAALRSGALIGSRGSRNAAAAQVLERFERALREPPSGSEAASALALVRAVEDVFEAGLDGVLLLVEEPELFLRPQAQRYLYRLLRSFALAGNQVIYSTHSPAFLNVGRLEELVLVEHRRPGGTRVTQPQPLEADEAFRVVSEFDAERSELFLARAAVLVEGRTEKLVLPAVFHALGYDIDRAAISIVECGGKSNLPIFARICRVCRVPCVAVHDRDAEPGEDPIPAEIRLNALIAEMVGAERTVELAPDFEGIAGLRGHSNKPERAWRHFAAPGVEVPQPLARVVELAVQAARS